MSVVNKNGDREYAIEVQDVKKNFKSYQDKASSFKERFLNPSRTKHENVQVLKGISFKVEKGEAIGLIGKNGCGKSTTLKLLTRILYPNEGHIKMRGRVSSLIELGAGFHPDMTGRENIYTNASIFGITRKEVDTRMNDIIRFSELEEFIDNPVRTYSSGMYMRLAFAVAINVDADILLIDEILAVGDVAFQRKCFEKLKEIKKNGTTIVIVSHAMDQMYKICDRLIWIENGLIRDEGVPKFIGEQYLAEMEGRRLDRVELENQQRKEELERKIAEEKERQRKEEERRQKEENERKEKEEERRRKQEELAEMERKQKELEMNETTKLLTSFCRPGARRQHNGKIYYTHVDLLDEKGNGLLRLLTNESYVLKLSYESLKDMSDVRFVMGITHEDGTYCYGTYLDVKGNVKRNGVVSLSFENKLLKGKYVLDLWIETLEGDKYDSVFSLLEIEVDTEEYWERGFLTMPHKWNIE